MLAIFNNWFAKFLKIERPAPSGRLQYPTGDDLQGVPLTTLCPSVWLINKGRKRVG